MTLNGRHFRVYSDQVGSVRVIADEQGRVVQEIRYCSFGRILEESSPGFPMPLGFAGGLHDRDVGWVRFGFRDYDPVTGRFTAPDPLGYAAGDPDLYGYCLDDPVNNVDPAGLQAKGDNDNDSSWSLWDALKGATIWGVDPKDRGEVLGDYMEGELTDWAEGIQSIPGLDTPFKWYNEHHK